MRRAALIAILAITTAVGCVRPAIPPTLRYTIAPEISVETAPSTERTLGVRPLRAPLLYKTPILFTEGFQLREYPHAEWAVRPDHTLTRAIIDALVATQRFQDVGDAPNVNRPELILVGELRAFEVDHDVSPREAVCEVRLELRETFGTKLLWAGNLSARVPLEEDHISAVPKAMSEAISRVANNAAAEIAKH